MKKPVPGGIRNDSWGGGHFEAPRGSRLHRGVDLIVTPGHPVYAPVGGKVIRISDCYSGRSDYQLVAVAGFRFVHRFLYVNPAVEVNDEVGIGDMIGEAQDISQKYDNRMIPHIHWEMRLRYDAFLVSTGSTPNKLQVWVNPLEYI